MQHSLTVIILTYNEEKHLARCLESLKPFASEVFIIDSFSTDRTLAIAEEMGAKVYQNTWTNQAVQFQWGLDNCPIRSSWVMRMDADEYVTPELAQELLHQLPILPDKVSGLIVKRQVHFMDRWIRHGGYYPTKLLRIWRTGMGSIEQRWMDEHIKLRSGTSLELQHDIVDHNLNNLSWWTEKHNSYATREAVDLLNKEYGFFEEDSIDISLMSKRQHEKKRWYKDNFYGKMPLFIRAFLYFLFRYFVQLGFLDGKPGLVWHFLQGFWYRFLVDAKIYQIKYWAKKYQKPIRRVITEEFGFRL